MAIFYNTSGKDTFNGTGNDWAIYTTATAGVTVNLSLTTAQNTINADLDTLIGIGNLLGSDYNDSLTGNTAANFIYAGIGNDLVVAGLGNDTIDGGTGNDSINGNDGNDYIYGGAGNDSMNGAVGDDVIYGGAGLDKLIGYDGADKLYGEDGNDSLAGGSSNDSLDGGAGNDTLDGGLGDDTLIGGSGNDVYTVNSAKDVVIETSILPTEIDVISSSATWKLGANIETLNLVGVQAISGTGNDLNNKLVGNVAANKLDGGIGNDTILGADGNDTLIGGLGKDILTGGIGADAFVFNTANDSVTTDVITDFNAASGDKINLHAIFLGKATFLGTGAFTAGATAQVNYVTVGNNITLSGDVNHDGFADFAIQLTGVTNLAPTSIVL